MQFGHSLVSVKLAYNCRVRLHPSCNVFHALQNNQWIDEEKYEISNLKLHHETKTLIRTVFEIFCYPNIIRFNCMKVDWKRIQPKLLHSILEIRRNLHGHTIKKESTLH